MNDVTVALSTPTAHILVSKWHSPLKQNKTKQNKWIIGIK